MLDRNSPRPIAGRVASPRPFRLMHIKRRPTDRLGRYTELWIARCAVCGAAWIAIRFCIVARARATRFRDLYRATRVRLMMQPTRR